jgi:YD repeat-containing protein
LDANGELLAETRGAGTPQAATWTYGYDPNTAGVTSKTDPNGKVTAKTYDAAGNLLTQTDALHRQAVYTCDANNNLLTAKDPNGVTTTYTYDANNVNLVSVSTPLVGSQPPVSKISSYAYGDQSHPGDRTSMTDPDGKVWTYTYDAYGDLASVTDPLGDKTTYGYDTVGRRTSMVSPNGNVQGGNPAAHTTTYSYDAAGNLLSQVDQLTHEQIHKTYDPNGNVLTSRDADNNTTSYTYDADNELTVVTRPDQTTLHYGYDGDGNQTSYTDGASRVTTYGFSDAALPNTETSGTDPDNRTTTFSFDGAGNMVTKQDPGGNCAATPKVGCTSYGYDAANEESSITYSDGVTPNVTSIIYDSDGQRTSMADGTGTSSWTWNSLHRLTAHTNGAGSTVGYGYDLRGDITQITYPGSTGTVTRGFDDAGRLHTVTDWASHTTTYNYDADSNVTSEVYANGTTATFTVDNADRVMAISDAPTSNPSSPFASFTYGRDNANQLSSVTSTGVPSDNNTYGYTMLNQLHTVNSNTYAYDAADNVEDRFRVHDQIHLGCVELGAPVARRGVDRLRVRARWAAAGAGQRLEHALLRPGPAGIYQDPYQLQWQRRGDLHFRCLRSTDRVHRLGYQPSSLRRPVHGHRVRPDLSASQIL